MRYNQSTHTWNDPHEDTLRYGQNANVLAFTHTEGIVRADWNTVELRDSITLEKKKTLYDADLLKGENSVDADMLVTKDNTIVAIVNNGTVKMWHGETGRPVSKDAYTPCIILTVPDIEKNFILATDTCENKRLTEDRCGLDMAVLHNNTVVMHTSFHNYMHTWNLETNEKQVLPQEMQRRLMQAMAVLPNNTLALANMRPRRYSPGYKHTLRPNPAGNDLLTRVTLWHDVHDTAPLADITHKEDKRYRGQDKLKILQVLPAQDESFLLFTSDNGATIWRPRFNYEKKRTKMTKQDMAILATLLHNTSVRESLRPVVDTHETSPEPDNCRVS